MFDEKYIDNEWTEMSPQKITRRSLGEKVKQCGTMIRVAILQKTLIRNPIYDDKLVVRVVMLV